MLESSTNPFDFLVLESFCRDLLEANWEDPNGPLRLSQEVEFADLGSAVFLHNTRVLLNALIESGGTAATTSGNLNRVFVRQVFDSMRLAGPTRESILRICKVINEQDVWIIHIVRIVSECADLVCRRKKQFRITRQGRELLPEAEAGVLFRKLFLAYFRTFDLRYDFPFRDVPGIQQTMAVILWRLDVVARDWVPVKGLASNLLLPNVLAQMHKAMACPGEREEWILSSYVLDTLFEFGLIERKKVSEWPTITEHDTIRVTSLWRKFISFANPITSLNN